MDKTLVRRFMPSSFLTIGMALALTVALALSGLTTRAHQNSTQA